MLPHEEHAREIIIDAIDDWDPSHIICLFSGGYDSMVLSHLAHRLDLPLPLCTYSIDTYLSADGWRNYVCDVAHQLGWVHDIYDNRKGYEQFVQWVKRYGCPYNRPMHVHVYRRLKERAIQDMIADHKRHRPDRDRLSNKWYDKILFLSGIRRAESTTRAKIEEPTKRYGKTSGVTCNPMLFWSDEQVLSYRIEHELPRNPFYETIGGSGDCMCNWGAFNTLEEAHQYAPKVTRERIEPVHQLSKRVKGWGWDERVPDRSKYENHHPTLFDIDEEDEGEIGSFLCSGCKRKKKGHDDASEAVYLQRELF